MGSIEDVDEPYHRPTSRVLHLLPDIWTTINDACALSPFQPVVNLGMGFFGFNPPDYIVQAAKDALNQPLLNRYAPTNGRARLRAAIANAFSPILQRKVCPEDEVVVTSGANQGILSACMAFLESGDEVVLFDPGFDQHVNSIEMAGARALLVPVLPSQRCSPITIRSSAEWTIDWDTLDTAMARKPKMIILNSPHNPIGKVFSDAELRRIAALCVRYRVLVVYDKVYERLCYSPATDITVLEPALLQSTVVVGSAGKCFYPTGWRVGWVIGPKDLIRHVHTAHTRMAYTAVSPLQEAVAIGFERADEVDFWNRSRKDTWRRVRSLCELWEELKIPHYVPEGGYYVVVDMSAVNIPDDVAFPDEPFFHNLDFRLMWFLVTRFGVGAIPLSSFYTNANGAVAHGGFLRFAVSHADDVIDEAKVRLQKLRPYICT